MPEIQIPAIVLTGIQVLLAFIGAFLIALWVSLIVWTFRDARLRSRDIFAILLATLMVLVFGPLGLLLYFLLRPPVTLAELYERSLEEEALLQDLEERPRCPGCSRQVKDDWILCPDCHTTLQNVCRNCQNPLHLAWSICPICGVHVAAEVAGHDHNHGSPGQALQETQPMVAPPAQVVDERIFSPPVTEEEPAFLPAPLPGERPFIPAPPPHISTPPTVPREEASLPEAAAPNDETRPHLPEAGPA